MYIIYLQKHDITIQLFFVHKVYISWLVRHVDECSSTPWVPITHAQITKHLQVWHINRCCTLWRLDISQDATNKLKLQTPPLVDVTFFIDLSLPTKPDMCTTMPQLCCHITQIHSKKLYQQCMMWNLTLHIHKIVPWDI